MKHISSKPGKNRNKTTSNRQIADMALTLWECSDHISKSLLITNMNSYFRDRLVRLNQRLLREAVSLGNDIVPPNPTTFDSLHSTKLVAKQFGLIN